MGWDDSDDDDWEGADLKLPQDSAPPADAWSDEEGHDAHKQPDPIAVPQAAAPAPPKPKTGLALKIEEREKREREEAERKAALRAEMGAVDVSTEGLDAKTAEKVKKKALEEAADLDAAIDAFGVDAPRKPATPAAADGAFESFAAATDADFQKLATMINTKLAQYEGTKGHMACLKALLRECTVNMSVDDCKDLASTVSVISNDKLKAERDKDKKKTKGKKGKLNIAASKASDMDDIGGGGGPGWTGGGGVGDDDYDFM